MFDMMGMMKKAQDMQKKMQELQEKLAYELVEGSAAHGAVKVVMSATGQMKSVRIDPSVMDDRETLEDLLVIASEDARTKAATLTAERMAPLTAGLPIPPGMKLF